MQQLLDSLPFVDQRNVNGLRPAAKARCILVNIRRQRGADAARLILAAAIGAECCPKPTSNERYRKVQVARSIFRLLRSQSFELFDKRVVYRISLQGGRAALALCDMVEALTYFWTKDNRQRIVDAAKNERGGAH
ncbi:MAG: hypothetical protein HOP22_06035 [Nitrospiraceae bacterium]|nr:hypothetical protein [Nitrospiraceae bacterium]